MIPSNPHSAAPPWLSRSRLTACSGGLILALGLASCGPGPVTGTSKAVLSYVRTETGALPAPGAAKRLEKEQSVFLRRHAQDPVDWYPWGEDAFARAKTEQKPVLVSIGYASCPWSQKMQEETFTDPEIARFMNAQYVNVLVDREERPDINNTYLNFLFWKSKDSGWPLHMWLTPDGLPIFTGVYFPVKPEGSQPSWTATIEHVANSYRGDRDYVHQKALEVVKGYLREYRKLWRGTGAELSGEARGSAFDKLRGLFDPGNGGFTPAPKFAQPHALAFLLNYRERLGGDRVGRGQSADDMVRTTLEGLIRGGINDQLGGGFHRYSTDIYWAVPQFEKMLYDQGFMGEVLAEAGVVMNRPDFLDAAVRTLQYADKELSHPDGGFYCAQGSSSPGTAGGTEMVEGEYYLWKYDEIEKIAGTSAMPLLKAVYDLQERGNIPIDSPVRSRFPDANNLRVVRSLEEAAAALGLDPVAAGKTMEAAKSALLAFRSGRPHPILDTKMLAGWNGTAISGFSRVGWAISDPALTARAVKAAEYILKTLRRPEGTLIHDYLDAPSTAPGYSEDYALVIRGLLDLYETTGTAKWLKAAADLQDKQTELLWDNEDGGFFDGPPQPQLFNRMKSLDESTEFAPGAISVGNLARLSNLLNRPDDLQKAKAVLKTYGSLVDRAAAGFLRLLLSADLVQRPPLQIVITGAPDAPDRNAMLAVLRKQGTCGTVRMYLDGGEGGDILRAGHPGLGKLSSPAGRTTIHFCRDFELLQSVTEPSQILPWLEKQATANP